jgi:hypothetical protein
MVLEVNMDGRTLTRFIQLGPPPRMAPPGLASGRGMMQLLFCGLFVVVLALGMMASLPAPSHAQGTLPPDSEVRDYDSYPYYYDPYYCDPDCDYPYGNDYNYYTYPYPYGFSIGIYPQEREGGERFEHRGSYQHRGGEGRREYREHRR